MEYPHLFSPLAVGGLTLKNRIFSSGHDTVMAEDGLVSDRLVAYQEARAAGGVGHVVLQVSGVHDSAYYTSHVLMATADDVIPSYRRLADAVHRHDCHVFGQLFHPGREIMESRDGSLPVAYAPSAVPNQRFHVLPRPMSVELIEEVVAGYGDAARRMVEGGLDGVEIVASHGYLPAQFLSPRVNLRDDAYGGSAENRLRFLREVLAFVRAAVGPDVVVGLRISGDEFTDDGLRPDEVHDACIALDGDGTLDYLSVTAGTSASYRGSVHIAPPMSRPHAYTAPLSAALKAVVSVPVFVTGRINQPQDGEAVLARGDADAVAMTRALICDPLLPVKARAGRSDDIRACIACNQACIGHFHLGFPISCIQHPETGREREYGVLAPATPPRHVVVVGGGPAGLKAAAVAAERGHRVTLLEAGRHVGGQALLAQELPGRAEFGGIVTNLEGEARRAGVDVRTSTAATTESVLALQPDVVVLATGAVPHRFPLDRADDAVVLDAWEVLRGADAPRDGRVLVADWRCDWVGLGVATLLAQRGHRVTLAVDGWAAGQSLQQYVRNEMLAAAVRARVDVRTDLRLLGVDADTGYLEHTLTGEVVEIDDVRATVLAQGHRNVDDLLEPLAATGLEVHVVGDALAARTAEEAVLDGLRTAAAL